ncbi:tRNA (5-methylaminomethyl-2-thiouridine)(34)-methyltransferase MnmD [Solitalea koreensis]|uniref:tRNA U34 5-methylaminomethyl-2-thiouridine-forming methyltransferase MnmC n=1 Tax=Solitalea koreensis TaxID=543615 RepID=A0A521DWH2_9SPHI|nr:tRNA (5-methylaminomethyl-2-thiouridine)(34)-methyltransferase MnmD [Solitalea koreensis]SMO75995.1 tRNA U34 5-methylaminomethyl-2-thiouridine-forming methyltransferase MnmC [Solitalea koreensis]
MSKFSPVQLLPTADGSNTLYHQVYKQTYHSVNGAHQEAKHVFLDTGLKHLLSIDSKTEVSIIEIGFGTGLNFLVTAEFCIQEEIKLNYKGIEAFPVPSKIIAESGYEECLKNKNLWKSYIDNYDQLIKGDTSIQINPLISLSMERKPVLETPSSPLFDIIYYDAFAPTTQPEMWNTETISHVVKFLKPGGMFVTYSITGNLKRILVTLGFTIEKPKGAAGKREMLRAILKANEI